MIRSFLAIPFRKRARAAARRRDWQAATDQYRRMIAWRLASARDRVQLGHTLKEAGDLVAAESTYREVANAYPLYSNAQLQLAVFLRCTGRGGEAVEVLSRLIATAPSTDAIDAELQSLGVNEAALEERMLTGLLRGGPAESVGGAAPAAQALLATGDAAGAVRACRTELFREPRSASTYLVLAKALTALGRNQAAVQAELAAWRLQPGLPDAAAALHRRGWDDGTLEQLTVLSWSPTVPDALRNNGLLEPEDMGVRERAIWMYFAAAVRRAA